MRFMEESVSVGKLWAAPLALAFCVGLASGQTIYVDEDFSSLTEGQVPAGWVVTDGGTATGVTPWNGDTWGVDATPFIQFQTYGTGNFLTADSDNAGGASLGNGPFLFEIIETPPMNTSAATNVWLSFDHHFLAIDQGFGDNATVEVFDGTTWQQVDQWLSTEGTTAGMVFKEYNLSAFANAAMSVRFVYDDASTWAWYWAIDNVVLEERAGATADYLITDDANASSQLPAGTDLVIAEFDCVSGGLAATINNLTLTYSGTDGAAVTNVRLVEDLGTAGTFDSGVDVILATGGSFAAGTLALDLIPDLDITTAKDIAVVADVATLNTGTISIAAATDVTASSGASPLQTFPVTAQTFDIIISTGQVITPNSFFVQDFEPGTPVNYVTQDAGTFPMNNSSGGTSIGTPFTATNSSRILFVDAAHPAIAIQDPVSGTTQVAIDFPATGNPDCVGAIDLAYDMSALNPSTHDVTLGFKWAERNLEGHPGDCVLLSRDGGATWEAVLSTYSLPVGSTIYSGANDDYHYVTVDLSAAVLSLGGTFGGNVIIRIQQRDNFAYNLGDGFCIDDVSIIASDGAQTQNVVGREETTTGADVTNGQATAGTARLLVASAGASSTPLKLFITNAGLEPVNVTGAPTLTGTNAAEFSLDIFDDLLTYPVTLYPGGCIRMEVVFSPTSNGTKTAAISFNHNDSTTTSPFTIPLEGDAAAPVVEIEVTDGTTPYVNGTSTVDFGSGGIFDGTIFTQSVTVNNTGNSPLTLQPPVLGGTDPADFAVENSAFDGGPLTVQASGSLSFDVFFNPLSDGAKSATLEIAHNATNETNPFVVNLSGAATAPSGTETFVSVVGSPSGDFDNLNPYTENLVVSGLPSSIHSLAVEFVIDHTFTGDIEISLTPPGGGPGINLVADQGGAGYNMHHIVLTGVGDPQRDPGSTAPSVVGQAAPFTGVFTVQDDTAWQNQIFPGGVGIDPNGTWTLDLVDDAGGDEGTLIGWALQFQESITLSDILTYDFEDVGGSSTPAATTSDPDLSPLDFTILNGTASFFTGNGTPFGISGTGWDGSLGSQYFIAEFSPTGLNQVTLSEVTFDTRRSGTGPLNMTVRIFHNGVDTGFDPGSFTVGASGVYTAQTIAITGNGAGPFTGDVELRILADGVASSGGTLRIDNFVLEGSVDPQSGLAPTIEIERSATAIADGGSDDVGNVDVSGQTFAYDVINNGTADLTVDALTTTGATNVSVSAVTSLPLTVTPGTTASLSLNVDPGVDGAFSIDLEIENNTGSNDPYDIALSGTATGGTPEIDVQRGGSISDGGSDNVGSQTALVANSIDYTIDNTAGTGILTISGVSFSNESNVTAAVVSSTPFTVDAGTSGTLTISVNPAANGSFSFDMDIANDDANENPFDIAVSGSGTGADPEIDLLDGGSSLASGSSDAQGTLPISQQLSVSYTIDNTGTGALDITSIDISNQSNVSASVTSNSGAQTITAGSNASLDVDYTISGTGPFSFDVTVNNNDTDEGTYIVTVTGDGASGAAEIDIQRPLGTSIASGGSTDLGTVFTGQTQSVTFTIENQGGVDLAVSSPTFSNLVNVSTPALTSAPSSPVNAGSNTSFTVEFSVGAANPFSFDVVVNNSDTDEGTYTIAVTGDAQAPPNQPSLGVVGITDFNAAGVGSRISALWTVQNAGVGTLDITNVAITGSTDFGITGLTLPVSLTAGQSRTFTVTYTATQGNAVSAVVEVVSNTGGVPGTLTQVNISGTAGGSGGGGGGGGGGGSSSCAVTTDAGPGAGWLWLSLLAVVLFLRRRLAR